MSPTIRLLRHTARLLLVLTPLTVLSGFLTAKWFLAEGWISPATVRAWHLQWLPLAFVPVVYVHSLCGILFLLQRNRRLDRPALRWGAGLLWTAPFVLFGRLYLATPPAPPAPPPVDLEATDPDGAAAPDEPTPTHDLAAATDRPPAPPDRPPAPDAGSPPDAAGPRDAAGAEAEAAAPEGSAEAGSAEAGPAEASTAAGDGGEASPGRDVAAPDAAAARERAEAAARRAEALLQERCTRCHGLSEVRGATHDAAGWAASIDRMIGYGATLSAAERSLLVRHLSRGPSGR